uniref:Uncharacterized protein n=1 Tax=Anguilla anguilla TaxID=7936 RepID=A0A0E9VPJ1_ANGAN
MSQMEKIVEIHPLKSLHTKPPDTFLVGFHSTGA